MNAASSGRPAEVNADPKSSQTNRAWPDYEFYNSDTVKHVALGTIARIFEYLSRLDYQKLALVLTLLAQCVIGVALAWPTAENSLGRSMAALGTVGLITAVWLVAFLAYRGRDNATPTEK